MLATDGEPNGPIVERRRQRPAEKRQRPGFVTVRRRRVGGWAEALGPASRTLRTDFATQEGTLYPLLSKMRRDGLLDYEWQESEAGPPRKYYQLTAKGKSQLGELNDYWKHLNATISQLGR